MGTDASLAASSSRARSFRYTVAGRQRRRHQLRLCLERLDERYLLAGNVDPWWPAADHDRTPLPVVERAPQDSVVNWFEVLDRNWMGGSSESSTWIVRIKDSALWPAARVSDVAPLIQRSGEPSSQGLQVVRGLGLPGLVLVRSAEANVGVDEVTRALRSNPSIEYFERNFRIQAQETVPDDSEFARQRHLDNPQGYDIAATAAWDTATGDRSTVVAVLDSGLDYTHPDLFTNVWINLGEIPVALAVVDVDQDGIISFVDLQDPVHQGLVSDSNGNGFIDAGDLLSDPRWVDGDDQDGNGFMDDLFGWDFVGDDPAPQDDNGHGTHVSGIIAAAGNNGLGISGVVWESSVMTLKFLDENNSGDVKNAILAANYVNLMRRQHGVNVRVVNNSWVSLDGASEALYQAFQESGALDILVVASAGNGNVFRQANNNDDPTFAAYPASFDLENIISVTATDGAGELVSYFNFGPTSVDLAAPGLGILSTEPGGGYGTRSGTSFAAPQVSAAALLLLSQTPYATLQEVRGSIIAGLESDASLLGRVVTGGRLNLRQSLDSDAIAPRASLLSVSPVEQREQGSLEVTIVYADERQFDPGKLDLNDIEIRRVGATGSPRLPTSLDVSSQDGNRVFTATYTFSAAGGVFDVPDNGDYHVFLRGGESTDLAGNPTRPAVLAPGDPWLLDVQPFSIAVPAVGTIVVTRADDTLEAGSLRAAVIESNQTAGDNTILLAEGRYELSLAGRLEDFAQSGDLDVRDTTGSLTIVGKGANKTVIDASGIDRVLDVRPGAQLILQDVQLVGGRGEILGGAVRNQGGTLTILDSRLLDNQAQFGGAIHTTLGELTIERSEISENQADKDGGGLYIQDGNVTLVANEFVENTAGRYGGGIENFAGSLIIRQSQIAANNAGAGGSGFGGGIDSGGPLTLLDSVVRANTVLVDSVIREQEPNNSLSQAQDLNDSKWSTAPDPNIGSTADSIPHVTIQATGDGTFDYYSFAVAVDDRGIFDIDDGAGGDGDLDTELFLFNSSGALVASNDDASVSLGGAGSISNRDSYLDFTFTAAGTYYLAVGRFNSSGAGGVVTGNAPQAGQTYTLQVSITGKQSFAWGGGIYLGEPADGVPFTARIENSQILENSANAGGGIFNAVGSRLTIVGSTISENTAVTVEQVGLLDTDEYTAGGGIFAADDVTVQHSVLSSNSAGVGGGIDINPDPSVTVTVIESEIFNNVAKSDEYAGGGGIRNGNPAEGGGTLIIRDSTIRNNLSTFEGGGLTNSGNLQITGSTIFGNTAGNAGGIGNWGVATIDHSTISGNHASAEFTAIEIPSLNLLYRNGDGGGIYNSSIVVDLFGAPIIEFGVGAAMTITNSTVAGNTADVDGAGLYAAGADVRVSNSIFSGNVDANGDAEDLFAGSHLTDLFGNLLGGSIFSDGHNLVGSGFFRSPGDIELTASDQFDVDPRLGPLADNGGPTLTHLPQPGSPAVDRGTPGLDSEDQRNIRRPQDGDRDGTPVADIGSVERFFGEIAGVSFDDLNANHRRDPAEPGLSEWTVFLDLNDNGRLDEGEPSEVTDQSGAYRFRLVQPGSYAVRQEKPRLWDQTLPISRTVAEVEPNDTLATAISLDGLPWTSQFDPNIGDTLQNTSQSIPHVSIQGFGNGSYDFYAFTVANANDRGIFDIDYGSGGDGSINTELFLFHADGTPLASSDDAAVTSGDLGSTSGLDAFIEYVFPSPGVYVIGVGRFNSTAAVGQITGNRPGDGARYVLQVAVENHAVTEPADQSDVAHRVVLGIGQVVQDIDFGNHADAGEIQGQVYNDLDGGGVQQDGELGVPGWKLFLDLDQDLEHDEGTEPFALTDPQGNYVFANVAPGAYRVEQVLLDGWTRTAPLPAAAFFADFSDDSVADTEGFSLQDGWRVTDTLSAAAGHSALHTLHFGFDSAQGPAYRASLEGRITSPLIDLTALSGTIVLEFNQLLDLSAGESANVIVISGDGETVIADSVTADNLAPSLDFAPARIDVSQFAGQQIQIAFELRSPLSARRSESVAADLTAGQTYFLKVEPTGGQTLASYDLRVQAAGAPADRFESNENFAQATDLGTIDFLTESGLSIDPLGGGMSSPDFYRFTAATSGVLRSSISFEHALGDLDLYLYNATEEVLSSSLSINDNEAVVASVTSGETYFLEVRGYRGATNPSYDLNIDAAGVGTDRFEDNDAAGQATALGLVVDRVERGLSMQSGDADWFQFEAGQTGSVRIALLFEHQLGDLDLAIYDQSLARIGLSESISDNEQVTLMLTAGQTYFVQAFGFGGIENPSYELVIDSPGIAPDALEGNENFGSATDLGNLGFRKQPGLTIHDPGDVDFFQFVAFASGPAGVQVSFDPRQGDVILSLYDASENLIATSRGAGWFVDDVSVVALGRHELQVQAGNIRENIDFGNQLSLMGGGAGQDGVIEGFVFEDLNLNRIQDPGEANLVGLEVFVDLDRNGSRSMNEPLGVTDADGYRFENLGPGTYTVVLRGPASGVQTWPVVNQLTVQEDRSTGGTPQSVVLDYFNDDDHLDVAVANEETGNVSIYLSDPNGDLLPRLDIPTGSGPFRVVSGNFDQDPATDLAVANRFGNTVTILANRGGTFSIQHATQVTVGAGPIALATGHLNDDLHLDLVVALTGNRPGITGSVTILHGGVSGFTPQSIATGGYPISLAVGQFNDDDDLDLAIASLGINTGIGTIAIQLNQSGTFAAGRTFSAGNLFAITAADLGGDERDDLAVADLRGGVTTYIQQVDGSFAATTSDLSAGATSLDAEDFDRDGDLDLAVSTIRLMSNGALILRNDRGQFNPQEIVGVGQFTTELAYSVTSTLPGGALGPARTQGPSVAIVKGDANRVVVLDNLLVTAPQLVKIRASQVQDNIAFGFFPNFLDIEVSGTTVDENSADSMASEVGTLSVRNVDGDLLAGQQFQLVDGPGDTDNGAFEIIGHVLRVRSGREIDFETQEQYSIRVRARDGSGTDLERQFTIQVADVNEPPSVTLVPALFSLSERSLLPTRLKVADILVSDDRMGSESLGLSGPDALLFQIEDSVLYLKANASLDFAANPFLEVDVTVDDSSIGMLPDDRKSLSVNVEGVRSEDAPLQTISIAGIESRLGGPPPLIQVTSSNPALIPDPAIEYQAAISTGILRYQPNPDLSGQAVFTLRVTDAGEDRVFGTADDSSSLRSLSVTVLAVNDPPRFAIPAVLDVLEDAGPQSITAFVTDISKGGGADESGQNLDPFVIEVDASLFTVPPAIDGQGRLIFTAKTDVVAAVTVGVTLRDDGGTEDGGDPETTASFVINIQSVNDAPSIVLGGDQSAVENSGPQQIAGFATGFSTGGGGDERTQGISDFVVTNNNPLLFSIQPDIGNDGTLTYTPAAIAHGSATVTVQVRDSGGTSRQGIDLSSPQSFVIRVNDVTPPAPEIFRSAGNLTARSTFDFSIDFQEPVNGFESSDIVADGATVGTLVDLGGGRYTATITRIPDGIVRIGLAPGVANDGAGNPSLAAEPLEVRVDTTAPIPMLVTAATNPTRSGIIVVAIDFREPVSGFDASDLILVNASLVSLQDEDSGRYRVTLSAIADGQVSVGLLAGAARDAAGNVSVAAGTLQVRVDRMSPAPVVSTLLGPLTRQRAFDVTVEFGEPVFGFETDDLSLSSGVVDRLTDEGGGRYTVHMRDVGDGPFTFVIAADVTVDGAGNPNFAAEELMLMVDATPPQPTFQSTVPSLSNQRMFELEVDFGEAISGFVADDLRPSSGEIESIVGQQDGRYTIRVRDLTDGLFTLGLFAGAAVDLAGNTSLAAADFVRTIDGTPPRPVITTGEPRLTTNRSLVMEVDFGEPIVGFDVSDVMLVNAALDGFQELGGGRYSATLTALADGTVTAQVAAAAVQDSAGNPSLASAILAVEVDSTPPQPQILSEIGSLTNRSSFHVLVEFGESVVGFQASDVVAIGATVGQPSDEGNGRYRVPLSTSTDGVVSIRLNSSMVRDVAGNENLAAIPIEVTVDSRALIGVVATAEPNPTARGAFDVSIDFGKPVTGFTIDDLALANARAADFRTDGDGRYLVTITAVQDGVVTIGVPAEAARDLAGNQSLASQPLRLVIDTVAPVPSIDALVDPLTTLSDFDLQIDFGELVSGFDGADLVLSSGAVESVISFGAGRFLVRVIDLADGTFRLNLPAGAATDAAGNSNAASEELRLVIDTTAPLPTLSSDEPVLTANRSFVVGIEFAEPVSDLLSERLILSSGVLDSVREVGSGRFVVEIAEANDGRFAIRIAAGAVRDAAGNLSRESSELIRFIDSSPPQPTLSVDQTSPLGSLSFQLNVDFGEAVAGFQLQDLLIVGGAVRGLIDRGGGSYSMTIDAQPDTSVRIELPEGSANDLAGNRSLASLPLEVFVPDSTPRDFGDAPASFPTLLADNGARHVLGSLFLGSDISAEFDGRPTDLAAGDSDDGVRFAVTVLGGSAVATISSVVVEASQPGMLDAWIDFNQDGDWIDPGEQVFDGVVLVAGGNVLPVGIVAGALPGETYARFRLSSSGGLAPAGAADDGEVEDYRIRLADLATSPEIIATASEFGDIEVVIGDTLLWLQSGATVLAQAPRSELSGITILGQGGEVLVRVDSADSMPGVVSVSSSAQRNTLRLIGDQLLDLSKLLDSALQGIDEIDLRGGDQQLILDVRRVASLARQQGLRIVFDLDDRIELDRGWQTDGVQLETDRLIRRIVQDGVVVLFEGPDSYTNPIDPFDVNQSRTVTSADALAIINELSRRLFSDDAGRVRDVSSVDLGGFRFYDVTRDLVISALDALRVINELARRANSPVNAEAVFSQATADDDTHAAHRVGTAVETTSPRRRAILQPIDSSRREWRYAAAAEPASQRDALPELSAELVDSAIQTLWDEAFR